MGVNRFKRVGMGVNGCGGAHGVWGTRNHDNKGDFMVVQVRICHLWPGKFPRTSCSEVFDTKWCGWVQKGSNRFGCVRTDP